tara:strand:+ start:62 stop:274 length:213 start_codon:yes stop_codon:yes gene_type:complete
MYVKIAQQTAVFKIPNHINIIILIKTFNKLYLNHDQLGNILGKYLHYHSRTANIKKTKPSQKQFNFFLLK